VPNFRKDRKKEKKGGECSSAGGDFVFLPTNPWWNCSPERLRSSS